MTQAAFLCRGLGSLLGQSMWDLWWTKWHRDRFLHRVLRCFFVNFIPPVLHYLKKDKNNHHLHHRVAQEAIRLRCVRSVCCGALLY
jgi:hypothetical protein